MSEASHLILVTFLSIGLLLYLVLRVKLHPFLSLLITAMFLGVTSGMPLSKVNTAIQNGLGGTLGFVATVVGIGGIFGQILEASGGTEAIARNLIRRFGKDKAHWSLVMAGFLIAIPVYFDVGFIILVPVVYALAKDTKRSTLFYAIPLLAGLAVTHTFVPPTPGPVAVADMLGADLGWVILIGSLIGLPVAILAGPVFGSYISKKIDVAPPKHMMEELNNGTEQSECSLPSFTAVATIIGMPLMLMVVKSVIELLIKLGYMQEGIVYDISVFVGHPFTALIIATLMAAYFLGTRRGFTRKQLLDVSAKALAPAGMIILIIGSGGAFKEMLIQSGVGNVLAEGISATKLPPIVLAFIIAAAVRITLGSATVSMITAAGIIGPILEAYTLSEIHLALIVISIASGATILSHVNDSGFWLVGKYLGLTEMQTLRSWTVMETIIALGGFGIALLLSFFV
ncbi:GntT/GntP/DsdX family permease [Macellibacteroides fermentans]|uniref:Gnt-I system low-affinity gluconate transporter n=1 Tax=Macellibacteroides fermentans TaxID=879969 RepID=A0A8E2D3W1_9PORP|nr:gluconate:H+ symporter [Macellibacteroides fermentans]NYI48050.1 Gnt-I system low-affinity gluconate transporter [Macellibacteroides fermentans]